MAQKHVDDVSGVETTGHEWDGIRELNNPMPRWWVLTFYATILWAIAYCIFYPAWPLINEATRGVLGYSSRAELASDLNAAKAAQGAVVEKIASSSLQDIVADPQLSQFATAAGAAPEEVRQISAYVVSLTGTPRDPSMVAPGQQLFADNCASCHGESAEGNKDMGAPALADAIWLKVDGEAGIAQQIVAPRHGVMPAWEGRLGEVAVKQLSVYIHSLGGGQ